MSEGEGPRWSFGAVVSGIALAVLMWRHQDRSTKHL